MRSLLFVAAIAVLSGCAAPMSQQIDQLNTAGACCTALAQLNPAGSLTSMTMAALTPQTPLVMVDGKRSPAVRYLVPAELAGHQIKVRLAPQTPLGIGNRPLAFAPVTLSFLATDGATLPIAVDSGLEAGPAESIAYSYALFRTVTVPEGAASVVFYADPVRYGTEQQFAYRFGGLVPAGGILIPMSANAKAVFTVYGQFAVKTL